jgi:CBS domain-containing protein
MQVSELMTTDVTTAGLDDNLQAVAQTMKDEDAGAVPVVDDNGELCGIVTDRDIVIRCIAQGQDPSRTKVRDALSERLHTVAADADVREALRIMSSHQIRRLPVVEANQLLGMLSLGDIAVKYRDEQLAGDALSEVSEGVKQETRRRSQSGSSQRGSRAQNRPKGRAQAISNRSPREEQARQARVSPARSEKMPTVRSGSRRARGRKAG